MGQLKIVPVVLGSRVKELVYYNLTCTQRARAKHVKIAQLKYRIFRIEKEYL